MYFVSFKSIQYLKCNTYSSFRQKVLYNLRTLNRDVGSLILSHTTDYDGTRISSRSESLITSLTGYLVQSKQVIYSMNIIQAAITTNLVIFLSFSDHIDMLFIKV